MSKYVSNDEVDQSTDGSETNKPQVLDKFQNLLGKAGYICIKGTQEN